MQTDIRTIKAEKVVEAYISAVPTPNISLDKQAEELFSGIREVLQSQGVRVFQERVFGMQNALEIACPIRAKMYSEFDDGVEPTWLVVPEGINGQISGVQVHAVGGGSENPEIVRLGDMSCGRIFRQADKMYLALSNISASEAGNATAQAQAMLEKVGSLLEHQGIDMYSVPRTWIWLGNILSWYDDFNRVRNQFFTKHGLISSSAPHKMPASTGVGVSPNNGAICAIDLTAVIEPANCIKYLETTGKQKSAFNYGAAFSRASKAITPAGVTIFISGTASIGVGGKTKHLGDAQAQIEASINNVRAVLTEMNCDDKNIVQATAYCKTAEVEKLFRSQWPDLQWPYITVIADICRKELLFEIEAAVAIAR